MNPRPKKLKRNNIDSKTFKRNHHSLNGLNLKKIRDSRWKKSPEAIREVRINPK